MSRTKHSKVMSVLEKRALCFCSKGQRQGDQDEVLFNKAIDETGRVLTVDLTDPDNDKTVTGITAAIATYLKNEEIQGVSNKLLNVCSIAPGAESEGVTGLIYENPDGFNTRISGNKINWKKAKELINELGADVVAYSEHDIYCAQKDNLDGMGQMFNEGEAEVWAQTGHNRHENVGRMQQGGTSLLLYG